MTTRARSPLEYSEVYDCGGGTHDHRIYMATDEVDLPGLRVPACSTATCTTPTAATTSRAAPQRNEIYYNWIEGALYHELELIGPDPAGGNALPGVREDSDVVGNVLRKAKTFSVVRFGGDGTGASEGRYRFAFNTVLTQPGGGAVFRLFDALESVEMHNNVFHGAGGAPSTCCARSRRTGSAAASSAATSNWVTSGSHERAAGVDRARSAGPIPGSRTPLRSTCDPPPEPRSERGPGRRRARRATISRRRSRSRNGRRSSALFVAPGGRLRRPSDGRARS